MTVSGAHKSQCGAALLVSLMLLLGLTIVGIASMRESVVQQRVVNSVLEESTAFQSAEYGLRVGEKFVADQMRENGEVLSPGEYSVDGVTLTVVDAIDESVAFTADWWMDRDSSNWDMGIEVGSADGFMQIMSGHVTPSYLVEKIGVDDSNVQRDNDDTNTAVYYRITARGFGGNDAYYSIVQSTIGIQL